MEEIIEGNVTLKYCGNCDDFINIMLKNGYFIAMNLTENDEVLKIYYYKEVIKSE